jgi:Domain of unknown function (DUF4268)/Endonuclease NucS
MPLYQVTKSELKPIPQTNFGAESIMERDDLQKLLREQIDVLDDGLMVIDEEFGDWIDSTRRIDLLCIDSEANLVVIELKRTQDGGHMELQALRYAAMVSAMTFEQVVEAYAKFKDKGAPEISAARSAILEFLGWEDEDGGTFGQDTRIVLASADFGKELTTAVIWLREYKVDIRCVRLRPHRMPEGAIVLDVQQLIPLPEASEFQTQIGIKRQVERRSRSNREELRLKFWQGLLEYAGKVTSLHASRTASSGGRIPGAIGRAGFSINYVARETDSQVELRIAFGPGQTAKNKAAFKALEAHRDSIENDFGGKLDWQELPEADECRVRFVTDGGYKSPPDQWQAIYKRLVDAMVRLDKAFRTRIAALAS